MKNLMVFLEKYVEPLAKKFEQQRHIASIKNGMISLITVLLVGSFSTIFVSIGKLIPITGVQKFFTQNEALFNIPFNYTFGLLSVFCALAISYRHSQRLEVPVFHGMAAGLLSTLVLDTKIGANGKFITEFLDSRGLFLAIFASLVAVEIYAYCLRHNVTLHFKGLPSMIADTFAAVIPILISMILMIVITTIVGQFTGGKILPEAFTTSLAPFFNSIDTPWVVFIIALFNSLLWFLGLNGYAIMIGFVLPVMTSNLAENMAAYQAGKPIPHIFVTTFWDFFCANTGDGLTLAIVILALMSTSKELKAIGKACLVPSLFGISEPAIFGLPIAYNPYLFIPFVFGTPILATLQWFVFHLGWVRPPIAHVGGVPAYVGSYLSTMDPRAVILAIVVTILAVLMHYPFFKMFEKSVKEQEAKEVSAEEVQRQKEQDALEVDF
ncbi:PTS sugar transporter subunit IIC [Lactiplantibacillus pingfangensis]|uniref:PTS sugar transporter subunit IIC n=1 Tax=Lactiplantibacillus pingfangensis TaxID=2559915 RepID=UPI0010F5F3D9|nr:PTS transporter subunit EIIC [Lactiplantibacillus pingfangensis]